VKTIGKLWLFLLLLAALTLTAYAREIPGTAAPTYVDPVSGVTIFIPEGMELVQSGVNGTKSFAYFSFDEAGSPRVRYTCEDVWDDIIAKRQHYVVRAEADDVFFDKFDVAKEYNVDYSQVEKIVMGNGEYFLIYQPEGTPLSYGGSLGHPLTILLRYWYGYRFEFHLPVEPESEYIPAMEGLCNLTFQSTESLSLPTLLCEIAVGLLTVLLTHDAFHSFIRYAGTVSKKTKRIALLHSVFTFLFFLLGGWGLAGIFPAFDMEIFIFAAFAAFCFPPRANKAHRITIPLPSLPMGAKYRIILLADALLFLWRGTSQAELLLFGLELLLLALSCALPLLVFRNALWENFLVDGTAKKRAHLRAALVYALTALATFLLSLLQPISLFPLLFSLGFLLLPLTELPGRNKPEPEGEVPPLISPSAVQYVPTTPNRPGILKKFFDIPFLPR